MKTITGLRPELLPNVLRFLHIYSQHQCFAVSNLWNASVRPSIPTDYDKVDLNGYSTIRDLFVDVNPFYYLLYMVEEGVQLPKLEFVRVGDPHHLTSLVHNFANLAFYYRRTINQLTIHIDSAKFSLVVGVDIIAVYFCRFTALKHLSLETGCSIVLDELLHAGLSLQKLTLGAEPNKFQAADKDGDALISYPVVRVWPLWQSEHHEALPIVNFSLKGGFPISAEMLQSISICFPHVSQMELKKSNFLSIIGDNSNISLDFGDLHLQYLSINLAPIIGRRGSSCNKVTLEIISGDTTTWYQRDGKCKACHEFTLKDKKGYINEAAYINNIRIHVTSRHSSLNQLNHLEDEEDTE